MYCRNCGKKLPDNARFCDRCNMSVRKKEDKINLIAELKEERLARRRAHTMEERRKKIKKLKRKRQLPIFIAVIVIACIGIISILAGYINYSNGSTFNKLNESETGTAVPAESLAPAVVITDDSQSATSAPDKPAADDSSIEKGYIDTDIGGVRFAYPESFKAEHTDSAFMRYSDKNGDAVITANRIVTASEPKDLMKKYAAEVGGTVKNSIADSDGYAITILSDSFIYHKKSIVSGGVETYYEIKYPENSLKTADYEESIAYMDSIF